MLYNMDTPSQLMDVLLLQSFCCHSAPSIDLHVVLWYPVWGQPLLWAMLNASIVSPPVCQLTAQGELRAKVGFVSCRPEFKVVAARLKEVIGKVCSQVLCRRPVALRFL